MHHRRRTDQASITRVEIALAAAFLLCLLATLWAQ